jgi:N-acetylglucosamine-6-phosphate deacetylase
MATAFFNASIFTGHEKISDKALLIEDGKIAGFSDYDAIPLNVKKIDAGGCMIAPGLIDLQVYGGGGFLFSNNPSLPALTAICDSLVASGTTGFFLTIATSSMQTLYEAIKVVKENPHPALLGLHFEGPYINPEKRGAHPINYIHRPEKKELRELLKEADGVLKMMTLAPEMCDDEIISLLKDNGVIISAGHSNATFKEAVRGFNSGITATTHLFNAMSAFHHRDTGLPGATFISENVFASIIADGIHVDFNTLKISKKLLNERLFLITDAVDEADDGTYVHTKKEDRFTLPDGTLSGSRLTLLQAVKNCVEYAGIPLDEALRMAATYPAKLIHATNIGKIEVVDKANLVIFNNNFEVKQVVTEGNILIR